MSVIIQFDTFQSICVRSLHSPHIDSMYLAVSKQVASKRVFQFFFACRLLNDMMWSVPILHPAGNDGREDE